MSEYDSSAEFSQETHTQHSEKGLKIKFICNNKSDKRERCCLP